MTEQTDRRITAAAGILGVILLVVGQAIVLNAPTIDSSASEIRTWSAHNSSLVLTAVFLLAAGFTIQLVFWVGLREALRGGNPGTGLLSTAGLIGAALLTAVGIAGFASSGVLAFDASRIGDDSARLLNDLTFISVNLSSIATALALGAFAAAILRRRSMPAWLGWAAAVTAVVHLISGGAFARAGLLSPQGIGIYVAPVLYYLWVVVSSVILLRGATGGRGDGQGQAS
jgi:Domain of unknown function (DUF4386)